MRTAIVTLVIGGLPLAAYANQEWSHNPASERPITQISANIDRAVYDGSIWITYQDKPMLISLGTPKTMASHGLQPWQVADGKRVTVDVLNEPADSLGRYRAQRILIDGKTIKLL
jgi:hypothetical protein